MKAVLLRAERNIDAARHLDLRLIQPECRNGNNDLVAGVENRHQSAHQCLRGADGYESFLRRVSTSETGVDVRGDFTAQFGIACVGRIMRFAAEYGFGDALAHGNRRVEIRFADSQRDAVGNPGGKLTDAAYAAGRVVGEPLIQGQGHLRLPPFGGAAFGCSGFAQSAAKDVLPRNGIAKKALRTVSQGKVFSVRIGNQMSFAHVQTAVLVKKRIADVYLLDGAEKQVMRAERNALLDPTAEECGSLIQRGCVKIPEPRGHAAPFRRIYRHPDRSSRRRNLPHGRAVD